MSCLPLVLASRLVENVVLAVDVHNAIFEGTLPACVSARHRKAKTHVTLQWCIPLVLDALDLVVHAQHDLINFVVVILDILLVGVIQIRADGFVLFLLLNLKYSAVKVMLCTECWEYTSNLGRTLEVDHQRSQIPDPCSVDPGTT